MKFRSKRAIDKRLSQVERGALPGAKEIAAETRSVVDTLLARAKALAPYIPFAEDAVAAYYTVLDPKTPLATRAALLAPLLYFITPIDALPDFLPGIGYGDDAAILAGVLAALANAIRSEHRAKAKEFLGRPTRKRRREQA